ncbi:MAG: DNA mismatch repair endonuclease MutL [Bacteroidales bacterium]
MTDIIAVLPDAVANQIAAGEVIQRPASVVKELVENAIDAGATEITTVIKDGGKTLIQVIDNGSGMSETDARLAFERHATSKIKSAEDLFAIRSMGFRGEALASIAAVAQVELKTCQPQGELGTFIAIEGSQVKKQEPIQAPIGTNFAVKNLFFNIPARRKFLKKNHTEFNHIVHEIQRVALANPQVTFRLVHNNTDIYYLPQSNIRQRIVNVFGKKINPNLIALESETSLIKIGGFIGKPEHARKKAGEQFFFINGRFMRNAYLNKAITEAYNRILPPETLPSYFIYLEADPASIDINIHPTKTEIKFEHQQAIWQIMHAAIKQALGKNNVVPSIDFEQDANFNIPMRNSESPLKAPEITVNPTFNPFEEEKKQPRSNFSPPASSPRERSNQQNWEDLYKGFETEKQELESFYGNQPVEPSAATQQQMYAENSGGNFYQLKEKYILTSIKSGLMMIDQKRAHERVLYEFFINAIAQHSAITQKSLFPVTVELTPDEHSTLLSVQEDLHQLGFDIEDFGGNTIVINGMPAESAHLDAQEILDKFLHALLQGNADLKTKAKEQVACSLAKASAIGYQQNLSQQEMQGLFDNLFACSTPNYTPDGKKIISILRSDELEKRFE